MKILVGDCRETLKTLADKSVHCCVTSPPYWGLRDYGHDGQIGLEQSPEQFVAELVAVFREVHRVLRDDGTCWVNLGDSYARCGGTDRKPSETAIKNRDQKAPEGLKPKDLVGIPWRVAFALQAEGWYLRSDIIWHKPNPMPESVTDRPTKAHEYIFLLTKSERYFYDAEAIKEQAVDTCGSRKEFRGGGSYVNGNSFDNSGVVPNATKGNTGRGGKNAFRGQGHFRETDCGPANREGRDMKDVGASPMRNKRTVWTVATKPYREAHFATYPPDLIKPCILAGCPVGGVVLDPFGGSGTTGEVALLLGRDAILCELNPEYAALIEGRTNITPGLGI